jgi:hypothetical protein
MQEKVLTDSPEQLDIDTEGNTLSKVTGIQEGALAAFQASKSGLFQSLEIIANDAVVSGKTPMLDLEFSYGRLSGDDVQALELPLRALLTRARGFIKRYLAHPFLT